MDVVLSDVSLKLTMCMLLLYTKMSTGTYKDI